MTRRRAYSSADGNIPFDIISAGELDMSAFNIEGISRIFLDGGNDTMIRMANTESLAWGGSDKSEAIKKGCPEPFMKGKKK